MTDNAKKFLEKVSNDEVLQAELTAAVDGLENAEQIPVVIEFAKKKGYELAKEDFVSDDADIELDELEAVTGGGQCSCTKPGTGFGNDLACVCSLIGMGGVKPEHAPGSLGGCKCVCGGSGKGGKPWKPW